MGDKGSEIRIFLADTGEEVAMAKDAQIHLSPTEEPKKFAIDKQAQKVSGKNLTVIDDEGETEQTNTGNQGGGGGNTPSGELEG